MVIKTGEDIYDEIDDETLDVSGDATCACQKWYLASDIDKRIAFYRDYIGEFGWRQLKKDCPKLLKTLKKFTFAFEQTYVDWLFNFCFTNLDKDFEELIK